QRDPAFSEGPRCVWQSRGRLSSAGARGRGAGGAAATGGRESVAFQLRSRRRRMRTLPSTRSGGGVAKPRSGVRAMTGKRFAACLILVLAASACHRRATAPAHYANAPVIIISIDTLRADHLPMFGYKGVETPNLDALRK